MIGIISQRLPLNEKPEAGKTGYSKILSFMPLVLLVCLYYSQFGFQAIYPSHYEETEDFCPTLEKLIPEYDPELSNIEYFHSEDYKNKSLGLWRDAIRIPTPSFDDLGDIGEDSRWDIFYNFSQYLFDSFPKVSSAAKIERVNTHGLVYTIKGTDEGLKPVMLCAHQDVVPVPDETLERWTYPPFEGVFDGKFLWGRGSSDCKNNLVAVFEATEKLLERGFKPKRTIIIALGFDEEISGKRGAATISKYLENTIGEKSVFMIIDEGGLGIQDLYGSRFALPSTGEKGYIDVTIDLITAGGHSSVPPKHTAIGIMADLIYEIEKEDYPLSISLKNPFFRQLQCEAKVGKTVNKNLKSDIKKMAKDERAKERVLSELSRDLKRKVLVSTTQAVDIIYGGMKINALPEKVTLKINHRVAYDSSIQEVREKILKAVKQTSERFGFDIDAFGDVIQEYETSAGMLKVSNERPLQPAPLTDTINNPSWDILGGTIRHVFEDFAEYENEKKAEHKNITVSPSCMTGNSDTRYYWSLTDNIYRFTPIRQDQRLNPHAIDERVALDAHIEGVVFFYEFLRNLNSYEKN